MVLKLTLALGISAIVAGCSFAGTAAAIACRGGHSEGGGYRVRTVVQVGELPQLVSHAPLRCQNMLVTLEGPQADRISGSMTMVAQSLPLGRATYLLDGTGTLGFDNQMRVPIFTIRAVHSAQRLY